MCIGETEPRRRTAEVAQDLSLEQPKTDPGHEQPPLARWWALRCYNAGGYAAASYAGSAAWLLWLAAVACMALVPAASYWWTFVFLFVALILASSLIPLDADSALPYTVPLIMVPIVVFKCTALNGVYTFAFFPILLILMPLLDVLVGVNLGIHQSAEQREEVQDAWKFRVVTFAAVPGMFLALTYGAWLSSNNTLTNLEFAGITASFGALSGIVGIVVGHEFAHRVSFVEKLAGRFLLCLVCYGHFYVEHVVGHHKNVGTDEDPASARYGESLYAFIPRVIIGEFRSACKIEGERVRRKGLPFWRCEIPLYLCCSASVGAFFVYAFGPRAALFFVLQSFVSIMLFQSVHYQSHYGLERRELRPGVYEMTKPQHSWECPSRFINMIIFNLTRHPDHHAHAGRRYQTLQLIEGSPQSPAGLPTMIALALIPPLWRAVMHPRLIEFRRTQVGQKFRHGPSPGL